MSATAGELWPLLRLSLALSGVGLSTLLGVSWLMALVLLRPPRMTAGKAMFYLKRLAPSDLGLAYTEVQYTVRDPRSQQPIRLAGWWIPNRRNTNRCVILLHGYTDAKVGSIAWAPLFADLGFHVLALDLRAHGDSGGAYSTAGYFERTDVSQIIDQFRAEYPGQTQRLVLFGVSLGAAVAAAVGAIRDDLSAMILECPYRDFPSAVLSHADNLGVPGRVFQRLALRWAQWIAGASFQAVRPVDTIRQVHCPLLVIQSCDDPFVPAGDQQAVAGALRDRPSSMGPSEIWQIPECHHVIAMAHNPREYARRITVFLEKALAGSDEESPVEVRSLS